MACVLQPLGFDLRYTHGDVPVFDVAAIIEASRHVCRIEMMLVFAVLGQRLVGVLLYAL